MCLPIFRSISTTLMNLEDIQKSHVLFTRDAVRRLVVLIGIFIRNILKPTRSLYDFRFKSYDSNSDIFGDLDLDL